jgi:hypothetical protein
MTSKKKVETICVNCKFYKYDKGEGPDEDRDYYSICTAIRKSEKNFVTGKIRRWYGRCKHINLEGNCPKFRDKDFLMG